MRIALAILTGIGADHVAHLCHVHGIPALAIGAVAAFVAYDRSKR